MLRFQGCGKQGVQGLRVHRGAGGAASPGKKVRQRRTALVGNEHPELVGFMSDKHPCLLAVATGPTLQVTASGGPQKPQALRGCGRA